MIDRDARRARKEKIARSTNIRKMRIYCSKNKSNSRISSRLGLVIGLIRKMS